MLLRSKGRLKIFSDTYAHMQTHHTTQIHTHAHTQSLQKEILNNVFQVEEMFPLKNQCSKLESKKWPLQHSHQNPSTSKL